MKKKTKNTKTSRSRKKPAKKPENTLKNLHKTGPKTKQTKNKSPRKKQRRRSNSNFIRVIGSKQAQFAYGVFLILFSIFLTASFFSYLRHWQVDDNVVSGGFSSIFDSSLTVENVTGKFGAWLSYVFVKKWFGLGSFFIIIFFINSGLLLLRIKLLKFSESVIYLLGSAIWISVFMAALFARSDVMIWGGLFGQQIKLWITSIIGNIGLVFLLLIIFTVYVATLLNIKLHEIKLKKKAVTDEQNNANIKEDQKETIDKTIDTAEVHDEKKEDFELIEKKKEEITIPVNNGDDSKENIDSIENINDQSDKKEFVFNDIDPKQDNDKQEDQKNEKNDISFTVTDHSLNPNADNANKEVGVEHGDHIGLDNEFDPMLSLSEYIIPGTDLLTEHSTGENKVSREELEKNKNRIVETLGHYDIRIKEIKATIGPTVTMYEIVPAPGIRISKIKNLEDDIALSLAALGIRIIAPIPGKGTIGIEVPNEKGEIVSMRSMLESDAFRNTKAELPFAMGRTITNEPFVADLTKLPHLLIAGATGQGKSVGLNVIISSLLYKKHPAQLKFLFVDPKKVELALYAKIENHFLAKFPGEDEAIITDVNKAVSALSSLTVLMDSRYDLLKKAGAKNLIEYNKKFTDRKLNPDNGHYYMPYIVVVIDEFADLIMTAGKEVELPVARIAQLARAVGIHLIVATQRPSVDVITGKIKANFPARISFKVTSKVDSRTILDTNGADQLIGRGDMLYNHGSVMERLQCAFIDTPEIEALTDFIGEQRGFSSAMELPEPATDSGSDSGSGGDLSNRDKLFEDAARLVIVSQQGSTSMLQTKLTIGFARARRIIDQLETAGIVGPPQGSKPREVLFHDLQSLEQFLKNLE
mgnify:CR=1 FL=1